MSNYNRDGDGMSFGQIARELGLSRSYASAIYNNAIKKVLARSTSKQREAIHELLKDKEITATLPEDVFEELDEQEYWWGGNDDYYT